MENDKINTLFETLENQFDIEVPNSGHHNRFLEKLQQQQMEQQTASRGAGFWKPLFAVAASIVLCFSIFTVMQQQDPELRDLASVSPELSRTQDFFTIAIESELTSLEAERSPETEEIINDALKQLNLLEADYNDLKADLTENGDDKRIIHAMISNFQTRIDVLQTVLDQIEEIKQFRLTESTTNNL
ncbi:MAG: hypothetical protein HRU26_14545 [Psychroserpens sp.]|nr:hypothetical protein [Psychroserpens sp.]